MGEFGRGAHGRGNIPGVTRTVSISVYDQVQASNYRSANAMAGAAADLLPFTVLTGGLRSESANAHQKSWP